VTVRVVAALSLLAPALAAGLEPRFDHRDQQGPIAEALVVRDVLWTGSTAASSATRGAVRIAWGFDPSGDGDEILVGGTVSVLEGTNSGRDRVRWTVDTRYRVNVGTDELKTLLEVGLWGSASDRTVFGPLLGLGLMYDFYREFGMFSTAFLAAGIGEGRVFSFGGGVGIQYRFE
jgi:hypothetical protein